jgi:translation initiation factor 1 (eIF-1/SUI1)
MPNNEKVINNGLALKVFEEEVCDHCSCKTTVTNEMIEVQTSFEE